MEQVKTDKLQIFPEVSAFPNRFGNQNFDFLLHLPCAGRNGSLEKGLGTFRSFMLRA